MLCKTIEKTHFVQLYASFWTVHVGDSKHWLYMLEILNNFSYSSNLNLKRPTFMEMLPVKLANNLNIACQDVLVA